MGEDLTCVGSASDERVVSRDGDVSPAGSHAPKKRGRKPITDPNHLTPSQRALLSYIWRHEAGENGAAFSKREVAERISRDFHTVDLALAGLRKRGLIVAEPHYLPSGAQANNTYRVSELALEKYPELFKREE